MIENMKEKIFTLALAGLLVCPAVFAKKATKEYQRPSLHMVLLNTDEPTSPEVADVMPAVSASWGNYEFPALYNNHKVDFQEMKAGNPKGGIMELVTKYPAEKLMNITDINMLKEISEMSKGKEYMADLKQRVDEVSGEVARQMVAKWYNITPDGQWNLNYLAEKACYSATQNASQSAADETGDAYSTMINQLAEPTVSNTYVTFSKLAFYYNEPLAKFNSELIRLIGQLTADAAGQPMLAMATNAAAAKYYETNKDGYAAYTTTLLYKLKWTEEIQAAFQAAFLTSDGWKGTIDVDKFNAIPFELEYMGADQAHTTVILKKDDKDLSKEEAVTKTIHKNINKQLVSLQNTYEEFKPMVPIVAVDKKFMLADMGTKESVVEGDKFDVLEPYTNDKGVVKYRSVGVVKVLKGGIWDNEGVDNTTVVDNANFSGEEVEIQGTKVSALKTANVNMLVKKQKTKK